MLAKPLVIDGGLNRAIFPGDTLVGGEVFPTTIATNAITITGQQLASGLIQRTTTGAGTDTLDTAANIIAAISSGIGTTGVPRGTTWRCKWVQNAAFAITVAATANTGVSVALPTINASSVKEYLVTVVNGTPAQQYQAATTNASAVLSGFTSTQLAALSVGMIVTNVVAGLQGAKIIGIDSGAGTVTMDTNATSTNASVTVNFSPVITLQGIGQGLL
jgi:hypothetical protein